MNHFSRRSFLHNIAIGGGAALLSGTIASNIKIAKKDATVYDGKKLNIALCGLGRYAGYLATGLETARYCHLAGIITGHPIKATEWKAKYNIPEANLYNYENFDQISKNKDIDLVYVVRLECRLFINHYCK